MFRRKGEMEREGQKTCGEERWCGTFERKSMPMVAWYMLSKESYMKRVIRDVLPTVEVWD